MPSASQRPASGQLPAQNQLPSSAQSPAADQLPAQGMMPVQGETAVGPLLSLSTLGPQTQQMVQGSQLDMKNRLPDEVVNSPLTLDEAHMGSMKAMLGQNIGNYVVATFLIGTQNTPAWEGVLFEVGNDYVVIFQEHRDRYIVCDLYSLKHIEFYNTRRQALCETLIRNSGWQNNGQHTFS